MNWRCLHACLSCVPQRGSHCRSQLFWGVVLTCSYLCSLRVVWCQNSLLPPSLSLSVCRPLCVRRDTVFPRGNFPFAKLDNWDSIYIPRIVRCRCFRYEYGRKVRAREGEGSDILWSYRSQPLNMQSRFPYSVQLRRVYFAQRVLCAAVTGLSSSWAISHRLAVYSCTLISHRLVDWLFIRPR